ncbi:MAG: lysophospholipid acyltransferase family protein [Desulfocapsaceae bacterium]
MKKNFIYRTSVTVLPFLISVLLRLWFATCRIKEHGLENRQQVDKGNSLMAVFWHYSLVYVFYHLRKDRAAVLVSASEDGEYIARLARCLNFDTVRGSSNRRGLLALKELLAYLDKGGNVGMVADGSQGPPLVLQAGSILLASRSGSPILPIAWSASKAFTFNSWDHTCIPKPFSRIDFFYGKPMLIPAGIDRHEIEQYRTRLEEELNDLYRAAWAHYGKEKHYDE